MTTEHWHQKKNQYVRCRWPYGHVDLNGKWCWHGIPTNAGYCIQIGGPYSTRLTCDEVFTQPEGQEKEACE